MDTLVLLVLLFLLETHTQLHALGATQQFIEFPTPVSNILANKLFYNVAKDIYMEKWDTTTCTTGASWSDLNGDAGGSHGSGSGSHHDVSSESDDDDDAATEEEEEEEEEEEDVYTYGSETASERRIIKERRKKRKLEMMDDSTPMLLVGIKTVTYNGKDKIQLAPPRGATYKVSCDSKNIVFTTINYLYSSILHIY